MSSSLHFADVREARRFIDANPSEMFGAFSKALLDLCEHLEREKRGLHELVKGNDAIVRDLNAQLMGFQFEAADLVDENRKLEAKLEMARMARRPMESVTG